MGAEVSKSNSENEPETVDFKDFERIVFGIVLSKICYDDVCKDDLLTHHPYTLANEKGEIERLPPLSGLDLENAMMSFVPPDDSTNPYDKTRLEVIRKYVERHILVNREATEQFIRKLCDTLLGDGREAFTFQSRDEGSSLAHSHQGLEDV